jgi:hypothetical protein
LIRGNFIGIGTDGATDLGNGEHGVRIHSSNNTVGGTLPADRNVISGSDATGLEVETTATGTIAQGNYLGTDAQGVSAVGNQNNGVSLDEASGNRVGGTESGAGNLISGNGSNGLTINDAGAMNNVVQGNKIGTDVSGTAAIPNSSNGISINGGSSNTIGGTAPGARNLISGNGSRGIAINDATATSNTVEANLIGTDVTGTEDLGNDGTGVYINGGTGNAVGGTTLDAGNVTAHSDGRGVQVKAGTGNPILNNRIHSKGELGIALGDDGVTPNDDGDADLGANNLQNYPVLMSVANGNGVAIGGTLNSTASTQFRLEFFSSPGCDASGFGEGAFPLGSLDVTTNSSGDATFLFTSVIPVDVGDFVTATATDPDSNTSEFSECLQVPAGPGELPASKIVASLKLAKENRDRLKLTTTFEFVIEDLAGEFTLDLGALNGVPKRLVTTTADAISLAVTLDEKGKSPKSKTEKVRVKASAKKGRTRITALLKRQSLSSALLSRSSASRTRTSRSPGSRR